MHFAKENLNVAETVEDKLLETEWWGKSEEVRWLPIEGQWKEKPVSKKQGLRCGFGTTVDCKTLLIDIVSLNTSIETHRTFSKPDFVYTSTTALSISRSRF